MGAVKPLDKEISYYMEHLSTKQKEVILSVVKTFAGEEEAWWDDKVYVDEMNRRFGELESGQVKGCSLETLETGAREAYAVRKRRK